MACFLIVTILWIFSVCLHEFGHAIVAYHGGDTSVREKGYLTFNPLKYTHPVYSLLMPVLFMMLGGIGLPGGAVYIERDRLRSREWETAVSLAGPAMNVLWVLVLCLPFWMHWIPAESRSVLAISLAFLIRLEISAVLFNLLPVPPLDGFQAISPWLPEETRSRMMAQSNLFFWGLILVMWNVPVANEFFWGIVSDITQTLNIDPRLAWLGRREYQFWR
jgi:Zn-dependent protease